MADSEQSVGGGASPLTVADCPVTSSMLPVMVSVASLVGCVYVIVTYLYVRALRQHPAGIMLGMSVYGAIYQFLYLLDRSAATIDCSQMGLVVDIFLTGQETYMFIFAIDLLLALKNPFSASKGQMNKYHVCGGLWTLVCATLSHFDTHYALFGFCWMSSSDDNMNLLRTVVARASRQSTSSVTVDAAANGTITSGIFFALYIVVVYCTSLAAILRAWNTLSKGMPDTFTTRRRMHRHLKYYVGCYFGYWTLVLGCYILFSIMPRENDGASDGGVRCRIWHLLKCLLLAKGMVNSLIWTRTSNILTIIEQLREFGAVDLPPHEDSINWALRLEILTKTTAGICAAVDEAEKNAPRYSRVSSCLASGGGGEAHDAHEPPGWDGDYAGRKECYSHVEKIILEYRNDHRLRGPTSQGVVFKDFAPQVFRRLREAAHISSASYRTSLEQTTKERVSEGKSGAFFYFTEDRKYVVKTLSEEERKFLLAILPLYYAFVTRNPNTFMTRFFGCHGVTMYGKTVYFVVMRSVFDSSLQIHERFDLKGSWVGRLEGRKPSGTVATCKFCNMEYVVGGSHDQLCHVRRGEGNLRHQYDQVGKDLNWNRHMALPAVTARAVALQLVKDSSFLCRVNCIDYSLLVGIHHRSFNVSHYSSADNFDVPSSARTSWGSGSGAGAAVAAVGERLSSLSGGNGGGSVPNGVATAPLRSNGKPFHQAIQGGMSVDEVHGPGIYFMGLIDMLQPWNFRKRLEHFLRVYVLLQDKNGISVVNPRQYAERFQQRVVHELIYDGHLELDELALFQLQLQLQTQQYQFGYDRPLARTDSQLLASLNGSTGRTRSTVIESFDTRFESTVMLERVSSSVLSPPQTTPMLPMRVSARMGLAAAGGTVAGGGDRWGSNRVPPHHPNSGSGSTSSNMSSRRRAASQQQQQERPRALSATTGLPEHYSLGPRLSDGLVMEPPGGFVSAPPATVGYFNFPPPGPPIHSHTAYASQSYADVGPQYIRRPLAPVNGTGTGSGSGSGSAVRSSLGRSESAASLSLSYLDCGLVSSASSSGSGSSSGSSSSSSSGTAAAVSSSASSASSNLSPLGALMTIETSLTDTHHSYQIVRTPTFPDVGAPTMSA